MVYLKFFHQPVDSVLRRNKLRALKCTNSKPSKNTLGHLPQCALIRRRQEEPTAAGTRKSCNSEAQQERGRQVETDTETQSDNDTKERKTKKGGKQRHRERGCACT